ncbi:MAG: AMP-binding protein, partial [Flavobacteriales bacterium]|nr:AMP-binding protein [Flavobacteriales bacterium]
MALKRIRTQAEYDANYAESVKDPVGFWTAQADTFEWHQKWNTALEWDFETPNVKWFAGGKLNITENCLDRHLKKRGNKLAIIWEPNDPKERFVRLTYRELHERVCQYANVLKRNGAKKGDRI